MFIHNLSVIVGVGPKPLDIKTMDWIAFRMTGRGLGADQYNGASCHPTKEGKLACWTNRFCDYSFNLVAVHVFNPLGL